MTKTKLDQQASITVQTAASKRDAMKLMAYQIGLRRIEDGKETGNVSGIFNFIIDYVFENREHFAQWVKDRILKSMQ